MLQIHKIAPKYMWRLDPLSSLQHSPDSVAGFRGPPLKEGKKMEGWEQDEPEEREGFCQSLSHSKSFCDSWLAINEILSSFFLWTPRFGCALLCSSEINDKGETWST